MTTHVSSAPNTPAPTIIDPIDLSTPSPVPIELREDLGRLFRQYDIRGVTALDHQETRLDTWPATVDLTPHLAYALGCAYASELHDELNGEIDEAWVAVGYDARLSGPELLSALEAGLRRGGVNVIRLGLVPTPLVYFATHTLNEEPRGCHGGLMVTGSHNPSQWNGFKLSLGTHSIYGERLQRLARRILSADYREVSRVTQVIDIDLSERYISTLHSRLEWGAKPLAELKVVIDTGHGASGPLAERFFTSLGAQVRGLYLEPDGHFPAHHPDPTVEANLSDLKEAVRTWGADVGLGFDGDGDRLGVVDREGEVIWGDQLLLLFAQRILKERPNARIIGEVKCSQILYDGVREAGGIAEMWRVGHSLIKARMRATQSPLAGEMSGHIFFADRFFGYDDAIYAGARLLERLTETDFDLARWRKALPSTVTTPELRVWCADQDKASVISRVVEHFSSIYEVNDIDGARVTFPGGWGLVRASNTQPVLVMRFEADDTQRINDIRQEVEMWLKTHAPEVRFDIDPDH